MRRILELDALRGLAALLIVAAHLGLLNDSRWVFSLVDLFFVLSGYFITNNVMKNRDAPGFLPVFFTRRALRIWPAYYLALAACLVLNRSLKWDNPPDAWPFYLTFTQNVHDYLGRAAPKFSGMFLHTWTLAIEEQFYVVWPVLLWRGGRRWVWSVVLASVALPPAMRSLGYSPYLLLTRCDGLAFGSVLALVLSDRARLARHPARFARAFAAVGLAALVAPMAAADGGGPVWFTTRACLVYFGLSGLILCLPGHPALGFLRGRVLCYIGTVSYGLYLYHPLVFAALPGLYKRFVFRKLGLTSPLLMGIVMVAVCFALAELSRRFLEGPVLSLKDRLTFGGVQAAPLYRGPHSAPDRLPARADAADGVTGPA